MYTHFKYGNEDIHGDGGIRETIYNNLDHPKDGRRMDYCCGIFNKHRGTKLVE